ncbi:MAG: hypothetical protein ABJL43_02270 [Maribacter dokdonensis]|uniref:hypothetical protein n=1 Tax=Maribacter dokdonensis TaxID=320912 RepID=UPI00329A0AB6
MINIFNIDVVLLGPFRLMVVVLCFFFIHQVVTRQRLRNYNLDYVIKRGALAGSFTLVLLFILILIKVYDSLAILILSLLFFIWQYLEIRKIHKVNGTLAKKRVATLIQVFRFVEKKWSYKKILKNSKELLLPKRINYVLFASVFCAFATMFSRYQFLKNDLWVLSGLWLNKLNAVKLINNNQWFSDNLAVPGEQIAVNFYSKILNISEEMALHSFGLLETFALSMVLYWVIMQLSKSKFTAPSIALFIFGFFYRFLPMNINLLLEHNPVYLALCFVFPATIYTLKPKLLTTDKKRFLFFLTVLYFATALTNLFVFVWLLPIFFVVSYFTCHRNIVSYVRWSVLAYLIAIGVLFVLYITMGWVANKPFINILRENLIIVDIYTYFPQLIVSLPEVLNFYTLQGIFVFPLIVPLYIKNNRKWETLLIYALIFNAFLLLRYIQWEWIDMDMFYQVLTPMIIINFGILLGVIREYLKFLLPGNKRVRNLITPTICIFLVVFAIKYNGFISKEFEQKEPLKTGVLMAYNELSNEYLPFSYAVVNANYGYKISKSEHSFIAYDLFVRNYLKSDLHYYNYKDDEEYIREHPEVVLPSNVFVFVTKKETVGRSEFINTPKRLKQPIADVLATLKKRGRKVSIFYQDKGLTVYQIVNKENASKMDELIFSL